MPTRIPLQFRPSLLIFVDEEGEHIHNHFSPAKLLASLEPPLRQGVGLIRVQVSPDIVSMNPEDSLRGIPLSLENNGGFPVDMPTEEGPLEYVITETLRGVQLSRRLDALDRAGYPVPEWRTQIFIVGHAESDLMAEVFKLVRRLLDRNNFDTHVCYVLSGFPQSLKREQNKHPDPKQDAALDQDAAAQDTIQQNAAATPPPTSGGASSTSSTSTVSASLGGTPAAGIGRTSKIPWGDLELANFCYLYEDRMTYPAVAFVTRNECDYAAAAGLFALIATGMTATSQFRQELDPRRNPTDYDRIGTMSTSMIMFPRAYVRAYCSAQLGADLMDQWIKDIETGSISGSELDNQRAEAKRAVSNIERWLKDSEPRPGANGDEPLNDDEGSRWPTLAILRRESLPPEDQLRYRRLRDQTRYLFELFSYEAIATTYKDSRKRDDLWVRFAVQRADNAVGVFSKWDQVATMAWEVAHVEVCRQVRDTLDHIWPSSSNGIRLARVYIDELDDRLGQLANQLGNWRESHKHDYEEAIKDFAMAARGPWDNKGQSIVGDKDPGAQQLKPVGAAKGGVGNAGGPVIFGEGAEAQENRNQAAAVFQHMPRREREIADRLGQRVLWKQSLVPKLPVLIAMESIVAPLLAIILWGMLWKLFPILMNRPIWFTLVPVLLVAVALITLGNEIFRRRLRKDVKEAREDLLKFYRRYFAYRCEVREDFLRLRLMGPLRRRVQRMRERLDSMNDFLGDVREGLEEEATQADHDLFNGPSASRDIFIANGERLEQVGSNTLEQFAGHLALQRRRNPVQIWHRTREEMRDELLRVLVQHPRSIIDMDEMNEEDAQEFINNFTQAIVEAYLRGPLVDIHAALDKPEIWQNVQFRAQRALYGAHVGAREPQMLFICGRNFDLAQGRPYIPNEANLVETRNPEWLLVAAFFRGTPWRNLNFLDLFPIKAKTTSP
jgi:hypothetical protein